MNQKFSGSDFHSAVDLKIHESKPDPIFGMQRNAAAFIPIDVAFISPLQRSRGWTPTFHLLSKFAHLLSKFAGADPAER